MIQQITIDFSVPRVKKKNLLFLENWLNENLSEAI